MATPTPGKAGASSQGRTPQLVASTPPVSASTPFSHLNSGVRSSPQAVRKSPANVGGMVPPPPGQGGAFSYDSPSAAALGGMTIVGGVDMSMESTTGTLSAEDTKARRLETMISILSGKKSIVTRASLVRVANKLGLDYLEEGTQDCILAGKLTSVDVSFNNNIVTSTRLALDEASDLVKQHVASANDVLFKDLQLGPYQSPLTKTVEKFEANLERLAVLDRIWYESKFDPHEALIGMLVSLNKIYDYDMQKAQLEASLTGASEEAMRNQVLCSKHGYPSMNTRQKLGLSLQYWKERRHVSSSPEFEEVINEHEDVWSLLLTCAPAPIDAMPYSLARISTEWVSPAIVKMNPMLDETTHSITGDVIDWLHPQNTTVPEGDHKEQPMSGMSMKYPQVVFKAELHPPVYVTHSVYMNILQITGNSSMDLQQPLATYDGLFFPHPKNSNYDASEPRTIKGERKVQSVDLVGNSSLIGCDTTMFVYKPVYAETLREINFSHPSQLVSCLPVLRQYAFLSTLLQKSFPQDQNLDSPLGGGIVYKGTYPTRSEQLSDGIVLDGSGIPTKTPTGPEPPKEVPKTKNDRRLDVTLITYPTPRLQVAFAIGERETETGDGKVEQIMGNVNIEITTNGEVEVLSQNVITAEAEAAGRSPQVLGQALMVLEDLGTWCEWMRTRLDWNHLMGGDVLMDDVKVEGVQEALMM